MNPLQQYQTSSSNKRQRPDASSSSLSQHSTEESFKRLRLTSITKRERPQEEGTHPNEEDHALQSFKRLRVNDNNSILSKDSQQDERNTLQQQEEEYTSSTQQAGQTTSSNEVSSNYIAMNQFLGKLHQERRLSQHDNRHVKSHLFFDTKLYWPYIPAGSILQTSVTTSTRTHRRIVIHTKHTHTYKTHKVRKQRNAILQTQKNVYTNTHTYIGWDGSYGL